jgi:hypothetical protein
MRHVHGRDQHAGGDARRRELAAREGVGYEDGGGGDLGDVVARGEGGGWGGHGGIVLVGVAGEGGDGGGEGEGGEGFK